MINTKLRNAALGICIVVPLLSLAGILWQDSEQQYVAMTNLALRLKALQQSEWAGSQLGQKNWPSWEMAWKPMVTAMQFEAKQGTMRRKGFHLSNAMHEQLLRFSREKISGDADLKNLLSQLNFSDEVIEAKAPLVFSVNEHEYSLSTLAGFHNETSAILASETAYSDWLSPILQQQKSLDKSTTCKTLLEIKAFQVYADRLKSKCATETAKWAVCGGKDEPITRQMQELQMSLESNLKKFKSRWSVENVNDLCSDI